MALPRAGYGDAVCPSPPLPPPYPRRIAAPLPAPPYPPSLPLSPHVALHNVQIPTMTGATTAAAAMPSPMPHAPPPSLSPILHSTPYATRTSTDVVAQQPAVAAAATRCAQFAISLKRLCSLSQVSSR
ncbi:hypothetical protein BDA96_10G161700 [Sorghum bicolor]|uniref:Uncharacterized protein n=1 Tax=Sorghum bicolor TaxID=4558 RepID=A0A921U0X9_SORBI|nr:hypothetical protein BDA96_10G161700 [Sorghum bicolor]